MSDPDRRRAQRIALQQVLYMLVGDGDSEVPAVTENFSSNGVLLYADRLINEGAEVGLILALPATETETEGKRLWCFGKVIRVEKQLKEGKFGMAIGFQRHEQLPRA